MHDVLTAKKSRTWVKVLESIMLKYIDIAVDLKLHRHAKDGLHQYRNISQQQAPQSLEAIIQHLLKAGESRVAKAAKEDKGIVVFNKEVDAKMTGVKEVIEQREKDDQICHLELLFGVYTPQYVFG